MSPLSDIERQAAAAAALKSFVPTAEEPSQNFPPILGPRPDRRVISTKGYRSPTAPRVPIDGILAVQVAEGDLALDGYRRVSHDATTNEAIFEKDADLEAQGQLRKGYEVYRETWGRMAAMRQINGAPDSPMQYIAKVAAGIPLFPEPDVPTPISPEEARLRRIEATLARVPLAQQPR
jgi:hypothetical protein